MQPSLCVCMSVCLQLHICTWAAVFFVCLCDSGRVVSHQDSTACVLEIQALLPEWNMDLLMNCLLSLLFTIMAPWQLHMHLTCMAS